MGRTVRYRETRRYRAVLYRAVPCEMYAADRYLTRDQLYRTLSLTGFNRTRDSGPKEEEISLCVRYD
jgi:hypothetical protein